MAAPTNRWKLGLFIVGGVFMAFATIYWLGARQLKRSAVTSAKIRRGAVTSTQVRDRSLKASDLAPGVIPRPTAVRAADLNPPGTAGTVLQSAGLNLTAAGKAFVLASLRGPYLTCGTGPCEADWGIYVDGQPVPQTGVRLQAGGSDGDGHDFDTLFGLTPSLRAGSHTITLNLTNSGSPLAVGQLGAQLGALALNG